MSDATTTMGTILEPEATGRDAVHVAVLVVQATRRLKPGEHCGAVLENHKYVTKGQNLGIVDPFLTEEVEKGEKFWLYVYPRTITGLSHQWTHPAFTVNKRPVQYATSMHLQSRMWIEKFAKQWDMKPDEMMEAAESYVKYGKYLNHGEKFEGSSVPDIFWHHYENLIGEKLPDEKKRSFFTCSC